MQKCEFVSRENNILAYPKTNYGRDGRHENDFYVSNFLKFEKMFFIGKKVIIRKNNSVLHLSLCSRKCVLAGFLEVLICDILFKVYNRETKFIHNVFQ